MKRSGAIGYFYPGIKTRKIAFISRVCKEYGLRPETQGLKPMCEESEAAEMCDRETIPCNNELKIEIPRNNEEALELVNFCFFLLLLLSNLRLLLIYEFI
jgi:hypothetical protein